MQLHEKVFYLSYSQEDIDLFHRSIARHYFYLGQAFYYVALEVQGH